MEPLLPCLPLLALAATAAADSCNADAARLDCGFVGITAGGCGAQGCCWALAAAGVDLTWCYDAHGPDSSAYAVERLVRRPDGGLDADLTIASAARSDLGADAPRLRFEATAAAPGTLRIRITDAERRRWEPPRALFRSAFAQRQRADLVHAGRVWHRRQVQRPATRTVAGVRARRAASWRHL
jgi:hypothetical protein